MIVIITYIFMIVSHVGRFLLHENFYIMYGLPVIPIFAYMIAQGYRKTRNHTRYFQRILLISVISEPFFRYMTGESFNDIFCYAIGLAFLNALSADDKFLSRACSMIAILIMVYALSFRVFYVLAWVFLFDCIYDRVGLSIRPLFKSSHLNYAIYPVHLIFICGWKYFL
jgi:hypothetical protein